MCHQKLEKPTLTEITSEEALNQINGGGAAKDLYDIVIKVIRPDNSDKKSN